MKPPFPDGTLKFAPFSGDYRGVMVARLTKPGELLYLNDFRDATHVLHNGDWTVLTPELRAVTVAKVIKKRAQRG